MGVAHLDEISERPIKPHFEGGDVGSCSLCFLQIGDPVLASPRDFAHLVQVLVDTGPENATTSSGDRGVVS